MKLYSISDCNSLYSRAVEMGANFLSEAFIFGVAGSLIILENARYGYKRITVELGAMTVFV